MAAGSAHPVPLCPAPSSPWSTWKVTLSRATTEATRMHLLRVSPSQRSGSSVGSRLGGSTFLCTGRLLGTGDPQGKQRYWASWEAAKGSELGGGKGS